MKRREDREKKCWISNPSPTNLSPTTALFSPSRSASGQRSKSTNNMPSSTKHNLPRPQPTKARKRKIKKQRANTFSAKAYGDLRPQQNKDFMFAATPCFVIHAKYDPSACIDVTSTPKKAKNLTYWRLFSCYVATLVLPIKGSVSRRP